MTLTPAENGPSPSIAERVVLSYPSSLSRRTRDRIEQSYYRTYLRKVLETVEEGDRHSDFTDVGCCGSQLHIEFRVERVSNGDRVGEETTIELLERPADADDVPDNPWAVQNEIG